MNKRDLTIKIISGQNLPEPSSSEFIKDIIDPYVQVKIFGVKADEKEQKTKFISDNGFNPFWNELEFLEIFFLSIIFFILEILSFK
jgi:Ca2+-dependent lipid-binding protein